MDPNAHRSLQLRDPNFHIRQKAKAQIVQVNPKRLQRAPRHQERGREGLERKLTKGETSKYSLLSLNK
jgi:hypothetical protein